MLDNFNREEVNKNTYQYATMYKSYFNVCQIFFLFEWICNSKILSVKINCPFPLFPKIKEIRISLTQLCEKHPLKNLHKNYLERSISLQFFRKVDHAVGLRHYQFGKQNFVSNALVVSVAKIFEKVNNR